MIAVVATTHGAFAVDLDEGSVEPWADEVVAAPEPILNLPRLIGAAAAGSTVVAVVDRRPPLLVSYDAGSTWSDAGRGLPAGRAVAISETDPDLVVFAARNRLYVSRNGGRFWNALEVELPEIDALELREA
jgi:hypothetical protein